MLNQTRLVVRRPSKEFLEPSPRLHAAWTVDGNFCPQNVLTRRSTTTITAPRVLEIVERKRLGIEAIQKMITNRPSEGKPTVSGALSSSPSVVSSITDWRLSPLCQTQKTAKDNETKETARYIFFDGFYFIINQKRMESKHVVNHFWNFIWDRITDRRDVWGRGSFF